jgi:hypothetical protein
MALTITSEEFERQIREVMLKRIGDAIKEEAERAAQTVRDRINREADTIALNILDRYDLSMNQREIIIRVRKEHP